MEIVLDAPEPRSACKVCISMHFLVLISYNSDGFTFKKRYFSFLLNSTRIGYHETEFGTDVDFSLFSAHIWISELNFITVLRNVLREGFRRIRNHLFK